VFENRDGPCRSFQRFGQDLGGIAGAEVQCSGDGARESALWSRLRHSTRVRVFTR
jgi:hypothetical protein